MLERHEKLIESHFGSYVVSAEPLTGGWIADTRLVTLSNGHIYVAKVQSAEMVATEAMMLETLSAGIQTPKIMFCDSDLLVLEYIPNNQQPNLVRTEPGIVVLEHIQPQIGISPQAEIDSARKIARMHSKMRGKSFGFDKTTILAGTTLDNRSLEDWPTFFAERRLLPMAQEALKAGHLTRTLMGDVETITADIANFIKPPEFPSLLHGDLWHGNMLFHNDVLAALIDPAIYYGHHEYDLATLKMFQHIGDDFFRAYSEIMPIDQDFFTTPILVYQLYSYLLHCRLFGEQYLSHAGQCIRRLLQPDDTTEL